MGSKIVKCIFLWFCQIFFPWHWWRVLAMTPKTLLCGGDSWRMLLWARVYQYVACHDTHLLCLLVAYLPWYPPLVPTCCLLAMIPTLPCAYLMPPPVIHQIRAPPSRMQPAPVCKFMPDLCGGIKYLCGSILCNKFQIHLTAKRVADELTGPAVQMNPFLFGSSCAHWSYQGSMFGWEVMDWVTEVGVETALLRLHMIAAFLLLCLLHLWFFRVTGVLHWISQTGEAILSGLGHHP